MLRHRYATRLAKILLDLCVLAAAFCLAFVIRFEGALPAYAFDLMLVYLPCVVAGKLLLLAADGRHRVPWRYTGLRDALWIFNWTALAATVILVWRLFSNLGVPVLEDSLRDSIRLPVGVIFLDMVLSFMGLAGIRGVVRLLIENRERPAANANASGRVPTLLIGAGRAGAMVAKEIAARPDSGILPIGFLDDDVHLSGMDVGGVRVLGTTAQLEDIADQYGVRQALITIANGSGPAIRRIVQACKASGLDTKIIPPLHEIVAGRINLTRIRDVALEDLLRRRPVQLDCQQVREIVQDQVVLVTGAGGSIGSELCRIVAAFGPSKLVLVEQAENSLFQIHLSLLEMFPKLAIFPCIADICDQDRIESIFATFRPSLVLHAAAHKHVPMMEWNPSEAVKNNVLGTQTVVMAADAWDVSRFVMISTDKAVNPSSVMGVSKRVAELLIQAFAPRSTTRFMTVRFGNVLGSAGSVIPTFQKQIANGGPVTVTHPDMKRYFMTIPEACQLVLQAASIGSGGEIFILDMGEPVKIVDIARDLIQLSGLKPGHDVEIRFTGVRPGEKLFEELFLGEEQASRTQHPRIFIGQGKAPDWEEIERQVSELGELADDLDSKRILGKFQEIVPEYQCEQLRHDVPVDAPFGSMHSAPGLAVDKDTGEILAADKDTGEIFLGQETAS